MPMTDYWTYEYNISIGTPPPKIGNYTTHYNISQTLEHFNDILTRIFGADQWTWVHTYNECIVRFSKITDNWNTILWKIIINWLLENVEKINIILVELFSWIENCVSKRKSWNENKDDEFSSKESWWDSGEIISTKA